MYGLSLQAMNLDVAESSTIVYNIVPTMSNFFLQNPSFGKVELGVRRKAKKVFVLDELELVHPDLLKKSRVRRVVSQ